MIILMFLWYYEKGVPILVLLGRDSPSFIIYLYFGCIIFSVGERKNSLPTLNFLQKNRNTHQISCII